MTMTKKAIDLFISYYNREYPLEAIKFLLEQFETISECESGDADEQVKTRVFYLNYTLYIENRIMLID
jgi:hypothetical protein